MAMATRLLLRTFRRLPPPPLRPPASPLPAGLLHRSPRALLPNGRWFGGGRSSSSSYKAVPPGWRFVLGTASFVSTSAAAGLDLKDDWPEGAHADDDQKEKEPSHRELQVQHGRSVDREKRKWTDVLIALNLVVHGVDVLTKRKLLLWGVKDNDLIRKGQLWRLATSSLLHGGMIHITFNMLGLDDIGPLMEEVTGPRRFLAIYCTSALAGSLMSYKFTSENSVGASDAIFGLTGAQAVYTWRHQESLENSEETLKEIKHLIVSSLCISLALRLFKIRIDDWAHVGGFLGGAAIEWFFGPDGKQHIAMDLTTDFEDKAPDLSNC